MTAGMTPRFADGPGPRRARGWSRRRGAVKHSDEPTHGDQTLRRRGTVVNKLLGDLGVDATGEFKHALREWIKLWMYEFCKASDSA